jgi:hypothetical protein
MVGSKNIVNKLPSYNHGTDRGGRGGESSTERIMGVMGGGMGLVRQASAQKIRPGSKRLNFRGRDTNSRLGRDFVIDCRNL